MQSGPNSLHLYSVPNGRPEQQTPSGEPMRVQTLPITIESMQIKGLTLTKARPLSIPICKFIVYCTNEVYCTYSTLKYSLIAKSAPCYRLLEQSRRLEWEAVPRLRAARWQDFHAAAARKNCWYST